MVRAVARVSPRDRGDYTLCRPHEVTISHVDDVTVVTSDGPLYFNRYACVHNTRNGSTRKHEQELTVYKKC